MIGFGTTTPADHVWDNTPACDGLDADTGNRCTDPVVYVDLNHVLARHYWRCEAHGPVWCLGCEWPHRIDVNAPALPGFLIGRPVGEIKEWARRVVAEAE